MSTVVDIPGGQATLRGREELRMRHRRLIETAGLAAASIISRLPADAADNPAALADIRMSMDESEALMRVQDATIVALLDSWTLPDELPTMATVGDMDPKVYDALAQATKELGAATLAAENFEPSPDRTDPTGGSKTSVMSSTVVSEPTLTLTPPPAGESTPTGSFTAV